MHHKDIHDLDPTRAPSVFDVDALRIARVYAKALLEAAIPVNKVDEYQEAFDTLVGNPLVQAPTQSDIASLLTGGLIPIAKLEAALIAVFESKTDKLFLNFLLVLNKHGRLELLRPVAAQYRALRDEFHKRVRVLVKSASPLTDEQRAAVKTLAETRFHLNPVLVEVIDPDLLGGLRLQVGDRMLDLSVRGRLDALMKQMIERSTHEIQRRRDSLSPQV
jgi:F-type H+-transporting ATPase subunit delta